MVDEGRAENRVCLRDKLRWLNGVWSSLVSESSSARGKTGQMRGTVRYPTCLRTEIDSNTISISARHPNSEIRISITHRLVDNPTTSGPYDKTTCPDLSIYCAIIPIHLCHIFMTRSAL